MTYCCSVGWGSGIVNNGVFALVALYAEEASNSAVKRFGFFFYGRFCQGNWSAGALHRSFLSSSKPWSLLGSHRNGRLLTVVLYRGAVSSPQLFMKHCTYVLIPKKVRSFARYCGLGISYTAFILTVLCFITSLEMTWPKKTRYCIINCHLLGFAMIFTRFRTATTDLRSRQWSCFFSIQRWYLDRLQLNGLLAT